MSNNTNTAKEYDYHKVDVCYLPAVTDVDDPFHDDESGWYIGYGGGPIAFVYDNGDSEDMARAVAIAKAIAEEFRAPLNMFSMEPTA